MVYSAPVGDFASHIDGGHYKAELRNRGVGEQQLYIGLCDSQYEAYERCYDSAYEEKFVGVYDVKSVCNPKIKIYAALYIKPGKALPTRPTVRPACHVPWEAMKKAASMRLLGIRR